MSEVTYRRVDMEGRAWFRDLRGRTVVEVERQPDGVRVRGFSLSDDAAAERDAIEYLEREVPVSEG